MNEPKLRFPEFKDLWNNHKIEDMFDRVGTPVDLDDTHTYREIGIRSHGKGIFHKDETTASEIGNKRVFWVEPNCFVVNIVFAWERAVAKTTDAESGMIASHRFPMYKPKKDVVDLDYITEYFITKRGQNVLILASPGGAGRNKTLGQKEFAKSVVKLPSLPEQQKIAEFLSTIDTVIEKQKATVEAWEERKKGVMQKLFSQEVRFKADDGSEFPDWEEKKLEDVVEFLDGQRKPLEAGKRMAGEYPYYGASGIIDYVDNYIFDEELILLSEDGANILDRNYRVCFLARGKYWVNNHAHVLRAMRGNVNGFLCEQLESFDYRKYNSGSAQPKLNQETCRSIIVNVPCLDEQQKIADCLSALDDVIEKQKATLAAWEEMKKGLLQQMFV